MARYTIPDETNSLSLLTEPDVRTFVKVKCNDKLLPVFEKSRAGDDKVTGFIPAAEGVEFSVGWYCGRTKRPKISTLIEVYFGETFIGSSFHLASDTNPEDALDKRGRFVMFDSIKVGEDHKQNYMFGKIPTTDDQEAAAKDLDYLDSVSAIRIKTYHIKNARFGPVVSTKETRPSTKDNGAAASGTATSSDPTLSAPGTSSPEWSSSEYDPEPVGKKKSKKEKKKPIRQLKYDTCKHVSTSVFLLRSLPWISRHLDAFFFQPKPSPPLPEPTVEVGGAIYVDTTAEEAQEDACAAATMERPAKRQKVVDLTETEEEDGGEEDEEEGEEKGGDEEEEENEDEGEGGYDDYYDYSLQDSAAQEGPQGSEAVVANDGDRSSFLADVQVGGTTASQRQSAEEYARSQASQLVLSLAQEQPEFMKIKQEVFARGSSSDRTRMSETAEVSTDATTSVLDELSSSPLGVRYRTAAQAWMPDGSAASSGANASQAASQAASQPASQPALHAQTISRSPSSPQVRKEQQQEEQFFTTMPKVKPFQSCTGKSSHGASATTSSSNSAASGIGVGASGARVVGTGSQIGLKR